MNQRAPSFVEFVQHVCRVSLTLAQLVLAKVAFDRREPIELPRAERDIARAIFGPVDRVDPVARAVLALVAGARSGKSHVAALYIFWRAVVADLSSLAPGEMAFALVLAPDMRLARQVLRFLEGAARASPLASMVESTTNDSVTLRRPDGRQVVVEAVPVARAGYAGRGRSLVAVVLDESAFMLDENYVAADTHVFGAVAPRVMPGGLVLVQSTPWARGGLLYELVKRNHGAPSDALAARAPTSLMRLGDAGIATMLERERRRDPANYAREYDGEFVDGETNLLAGSDVDGCTDDVANRPYRAECNYGLVIDVGLRRDATAMMVIHREEHARNGATPVDVVVVDAIRYLKPSILHRISIDEVETALVALATRYRVTHVHGDLHFADALSPRLRGRGITFVEAPMHPAAQERRAAALASRIAAGTIRLVKDATLLRELKDVRVVRHPGGRQSVEARPGKHDEGVDLCLLACGDVAPTLTPSGGTVEMTVAITRDGPNVSLEPRWHERRIDPMTGEARYLPTLPPRGSIAWRQRLEQLRAEGITVPDHALLDDIEDGGEPAWTTPIRDQG